VAEKPVAAIEASGIGPQEPLHAWDEVCLGRFHNQVEMIAHQAPGVNLPVGFGTGLPQRIQKQLPVFVAAENVFAVIPSAHDVVGCSRILESQFTCPELSQNFAELSILRPLYWRRTWRKSWGLRTAKAGAEEAEKLPDGTPRPEK
jgi:hypothetical protein